MTDPQIEQGEIVDLDTRIGGGPTVKRDPHCEDVYSIEGSRGALSVGEIETLAELAGVK